MCNFLSLASGDLVDSVIVDSEDLGCWEADIASPSLEIGSTVAYRLMPREGRKMGRVSANRRGVKGRRLAIVNEYGLGCRLCTEG